MKRQPIISAAVFYVLEFGCDVFPGLGEQSVGKSTAVTDCIFLRAVLY